MGLSDAQRDNLEKITMSWIKTPFARCSCVKGSGVDCGQIIKGVYQEAGFCVEGDGIPLPETYSIQVWQHKDDTSYIDTILKYMREVPESEVKKGDVVLYKMGRGWAHAAIVIHWPEFIVHVTEHDGVVAGHGGQGQRNLKFNKMEKKFFTLCDDRCGVTE